MKLIAFDPGRTTSFALYDTMEPWRVEVGTLDMIGSGRLLRPCPIDLMAKAKGFDVAVVEEVGARPGQGVSAMFTFGMVVGTLLGALSAIGMPITLVSPQEWKRSCRLSSLVGDEAKDAARAAAKELWPEHGKILSVKKNHGLAEAALMARWYVEAGPGRDVRRAAPDQKPKAA
jgi:hypothetical protein